MPCPPRRTQKKKSRKACLPAVGRKGAKGCFRFPFAPSRLCAKKMKRISADFLFCLPSLSASFFLYDPRDFFYADSRRKDPQIFCFSKGLSALFFLINPREKKIISQSRKGAKGCFRILFASLRAKKKPPRRTRRFFVFPQGFISVIFPF